ncbi:MAG: hypothetical protein ACOYN0_08940 [Phycisphaerales bacterium]
MSEPIPTPVQWRRPKLVRALRFGRVASLVGFVLSLLIVAASYMVEWSVFTASAARPKAMVATTPPGGVPAAPRMERDEHHFMLGQGGVYFYSLNVYSETFDRVGADESSRSLAWFTLKNYFGMGVAYRWMSTPSGPIIGVKAWPLPILPVLVWTVCWGIARAQVRRSQCKTCRYDLSATAPDALGRVVCPECGEFDY